MKRKAIKLASNTLVISLPAKWVSLNKITKGTDLEVTEKASYLVVKRHSAAKSVHDRITFDISDLNVTLLWNMMNSIYSAGYEEIRLNFNKTRIKNIKTGKYESTIDVISRISDTLIGMEIIRQSKDSCLIKQVTEFRPDAFDNILNRLFMSLILFAEDIHNSYQEKDSDTLMHISQYSEININKLSLYCFRFLNTEGREEFIKSNAEFMIVSLMEQIGDLYSDIAEMLSKDVKQDKTVLDTLTKTKDALRLVNRFVLKPKKDIMIEFHKLRTDTKKSIRSVVSSRRSMLNHTLLHCAQVLDLQQEICNRTLAAHSSALGHVE